MSKSAVLLLSVVLAFPLLSLATTNTFQNTGGTISSSGNSLRLAGSTLSTVSLGSIHASGILGTVSFTTGALTSGSLDDGGTFAAGGSFIVRSNAGHGMPGGVVFQGTFSGPVTWKAVWNPSGDKSGSWTYQLSGTITGMLDGHKVSAKFVANTFDVSRGAEFSTSVRFKDGTATMATSSVPEPSTLALLGSGLVGLGMLGFRKRAARQN